MERGLFLNDVDQFAHRKREVEAHFRVEQSLPEMVFREVPRCFKFQDFDWAISADFWPSAQALCRSSADASLLIAVLEPDPIHYYKKEFGYYNWAELSASASSEDYWTMLSCFPSESRADSILANSEKVVWLPPSKKWAIWGERSCEVCVLGGWYPAGLSSWNSLEWALEMAMPNAFAGGAVPTGFAQQIRQNYGLTP